MASLEYRLFRNKGIIFVQVNALAALFQWHMFT